VEIDPETGIIHVDRYMSVNDFGTIVNPLLVEGQIHGGVAQGVGQALMERVVFDEHGQLLTGSFMDYQLPRAGDLPDIGFASHPVPATTNPLGAKGCGEAGCAGSLTSVMNAVVDALSDLGIRHIDMPATPEIVEVGAFRKGRMEAVVNILRNIEVRIRTATGERHIKFLPFGVVTERADCGRWHGVRLISRGVCRAEGCAASAPESCRS
jgi:hypothetical protein